MGTFWWFFVLLCAPRNAASWEVSSNITTIVRGFMNRIMDSEKIARLIMEFRTRQYAIAVVGNKHRTLLGGVGIELASYRF